MGRAFVDDRAFDRPSELAVGIESKDVRLRFRKKPTTKIEIDTPISNHVAYAGERFSPAISLILDFMTAVSSGF